LDGFDSHCTSPFLEACDEYKVSPFLLPAHSSHFLQALDVGVFQPYKHWYSQAVNQATRDGYGDINKVEFLHAFKEVRSKALKVNTIRGGFRRCELILKPSLVLDELRSRLDEFHAPLPEVDSDGGMEVPITPRALLDHSCKLTDRLRHDDLSSPTQRCYDSFVEGAKEQANIGQQAWHHIAHTEAATAARERRNKLGKKVVGSGGPMYVEQGRDMVASRETREEEAAIRVFE